MGFRDFKRSDRVAAQMRRTMATAIHQNLPDEDTSFITISDVEVTRDLSVATIFINTLDPSQEKLALQTLRLNAKALRKVMSQEMNMRKVPELRFKYDASLEYGQKLEYLIQKARATDPNLPDDEE
ncbi:30S ribosome-binding factor RbfA [Marinicella rhabdoformis]|uniref:30S ribosome-binding factor RbfA n=1 Tax=Marinicella rhabdoformis TaxID=2580566 RepID=UPI0012AEDAFC|nr:30S ribosome-binding factor RbfA [Marinicella rhabdoformis]